MKTKLILLAGVVAVLSSCSTAYRMGQTPDDVYYSPAPSPQDEYVSTYNQQDRNSYGYNNADNNRDQASMPAYSPNLAYDYGFGYSPYSSFGSSLYSPYSSFYYSPYSSFYNPYSSFYSPYSGYSLFYSYPYNGGFGGLYNYGGGLFNGFYSPYNSFYSPYYSNYYYPSVSYPSKPGNTAGNTVQPRRFNLRPYNSGTPRTSTGGDVNVPPVPVRGFGISRNNNRISSTNANTNSQSSRRRVIRQYDNNNDNRNTRSFNNRNDNNYNDNRQSRTRTFQPSPQPSSTPSSSPASSGSGSAPVRTFRR